MVGVRKTRLDAVYCYVEFSTRGQPTADPHGDVCRSTQSKCSMLTLIFCNEPAFMCSDDTKHRYQVGIYAGLPERQAPQRCPHTNPNPAPHIPPHCPFAFSLL